MGLKKTENTQKTIIKIGGVIIINLLLIIMSASIGFIIESGCAKADNEISRHS